jgi:hypothetical protein
MPLQGTLAHLRTLQRTRLRGRVQSSDTRVELIYDLHPADMTKRIYID